jgi:hypothetical protein
MLVLIVYRAGGWRIFEVSSWLGTASVLVAVGRIAGVKHPVRRSTVVASASWSRPGLVDIFSFTQ